MSGEQHDPTDPARWIDPATAGPADREALRGAFRDDFYGDDFYEESRDDEFGLARTQRFRRYVVAVIVLLVLVVIGLIVLNGDDDSASTDDDIETPTPPVDTDDDSTDPVNDDPASDDDPSSDDPEPIEPEPEPEPPGTTGDPMLDEVLTALGVDPGDPRLRFLPDALADLLDSISANTPTFVSDDVDIAQLTEIVLRMSPAEVARVFNQSTVECGASEPFLVVCPDGVVDMPDGEVLALGMTLVAPAPDGNTEQSYIYSAVFDSDGDPANDWVFNPPFDFDLFQAADRWYELSWSHTAQTWSISVSQVGTDQTIAPATSAVRAVVTGNHVIFLVPRSEVGEGAYRLTSFGHDGAFSESNRGADVSGADPTAPLTVPTAEPIDTEPR